MRIPLIAGLVLAAVAVAACGKNSDADAHLKAAGQEARQAASDVGQAIDSATPGIKQAGRALGRAAHDAGEQIKQSGDKAKQDSKD